MWKPYQHLFTSFCTNFPWELCIDAVRSLYQLSGWVDLCNPALSGQKSSRRYSCPSVFQDREPIDQVGVVLALFTDTGTCRSYIQRSFIRGGEGLVNAQFILLKMQLNGWTMANGCCLHSGIVCNSWKVLNSLHCSACSRCYWAFREQAGTLENCWKIQMNPRVQLRGPGEAIPTLFYQQKK